MKTYQIRIIGGHTIQFRAASAASALITARKFGARWVAAV